MNPQHCRVFTRNNGEVATLLKPQLYCFDGGKTRHTKYRKKSILAKNLASLEVGSSHTIYSSLRPKMPPKKLFEEPRFFMSLQRRKERIIDGLVNFREFGEKNESMNTLRGNKLKNLSSQRRTSTPVLSDSGLFAQVPRGGWQSKSRTPYLNYNMQFLIKKRKTMTPTVSHYEYNEPRAGERIRESKRVDDRV